MFQLPLLEYNVSHPHPNNRLFLLATVLLFLIVLPLIVYVNVATLGLELVPSFQPNYQKHDSFLVTWWGTRHLPRSLRPKLPPCEPGEIGRGDTIRLSASLFDYTVMSTWNTSQSIETSAVREQKRVEYRGQSLENCYVETALYKYSTVQQTQSIDVGVECLGSPDYPIYVSMRTTLALSWFLNDDFVYQYYGPGKGTLNLTQHSNSSDYRNLVLGALATISTDLLTILHRPHLPTPIAGTSIAFYLDPDTGNVRNGATSLTYANMTQPDRFPAEAMIYAPGTFNLMKVVMDAVNLDLGDRRFPNIFTNFTHLRHTIGPNPPPTGINSADWVEWSREFYYGKLPSPYQTWAQMLLDGRPVKLGNPTGLPEKSVIVTTYLCPVYQVKPIGSLLASVFVGSATMIMSVWGLWMLLTTYLARRIEEPRIQCTCSNCEKREAEEARWQGASEEEQRSQGEENRVATGMLARLATLRGVLRRTRNSKPGEAENVIYRSLEAAETPHPERPTHISILDSKEV